MEPEIWTGCYEDNWNGSITPESFAHPAKFAKGLIDRIFRYMLAEGMLSAGSVCVDPFGGIASGGIVAAGLGLQWIGCELEEKFWKLGNQNIELHRRTWEEFGDPVPVLVNGDSRELRENLAGVLADGPGNLGNLEAGDVAAVVTSPPWEGSTQGTDAEFMERMEAEQNPGPRAVGRKTPPQNYGDSDGQLGSESGETFWHAARDIASECYAILKPGGYAAFVVKAFVRNKTIVDFPGDWRKLCESLGFVCVKEVRAMLVKETRHRDLFGGEDHVKTTDRKSFFRRLHEKKYPENSIDWEVVYFFRKP